MATVFDISEYILKRADFMPTMKLQKLSYYSQAYSLVHYGKPLFDEDFEAWASGPVCPALFAVHRDKFVVGHGELSYPVPLRADEMENEARAVVAHVLEVLGSYSGRELSELVHRESPWIDARVGAGDGGPCNAVISKSMIQRYYSTAQCGNPVFV